MEGQQEKEQNKETKTEQEQANGSVIQEATSTTQGEDVVTKRSIRLQTWKKFQEEKCGVSFSSIFNRIPDFVGSDKAAALLADTQEFKNANNIKVNIDRAQDPVKLQVISTGKNLYLSPARESKAIYTKIECPADADEELKKKIIKIQNMKEQRNDIDLENKVKLDLVVVGSVAVSRDGYRIGRGNGFLDLDIGILVEAGVLTPDTVIVTTVHDIQVSDTLPTNLFQKYDTPVDIIVTPTEVIRVNKRLPRPTGIFWELLSERRLKIVPVLQVIKENEEKLGKIINLKAEDTDVETNARPQRQRPRRRPYRNRNLRTKSKNNENQENVTPRPERRRRFGGKTRKPKSDGEQSSNENKENNQNVRRKRNNRDFCVKVSNIAKSVRVKDLKAELRKRNCNPIYITWKGAFGRCYLHFANRSGKGKEAEIEEVLKSLNDLSLTVGNGEKEKTITLDVELLNIEEDKNRIESANTTSV